MKSRKSAKSETLYFPPAFNWLQIYSNGTFNFKAVKNLLNSGSFSSCSFLSPPPPPEPPAPPPAALPAPPALPLAAALAPYYYHGSIASFGSFGAATDFTPFNFGGCFFGFGASGTFGFLPLGTAAFLSFFSSFFFSSFFGFSGFILGYLGGATPPPFGGAGGGPPFGTGGGFGKLVGTLGATGGGPF